MKILTKENDNPELYFEERCFITELLNVEEFAGFSLSKARVEPGVTTVLHGISNTSEVYYILDGTGTMEVGGRVIGSVGRGDTVFISEGESQRITNTGGKDLVFLCICSPRFVPIKYKNLEK